MKKALYVELFLLGVSLCALSAWADVKFEAGINNGYESNLIKDNNDIYDVYTTTSGRVYLYPVSFAEINGGVDYTYYSRTYRINDFTSGGEITLIPNLKDSPLIPYAKSSFYGSRYRAAYSGFNNNSGDMTAGLLYRAAGQMYFRMGGKYNQTSYVDNDIYDQKSYEFFAGVNATILHNNTIDIEAGFGKADYSSFREDLDPFAPNADIIDSIPDTFLVSKKLNSYYISPRFSRPLGAKTGLSITYTYRNFTNDKDGIVFGSSNENLSPWSSLWEGHSVTATIKTLFFTDAIVTAGLGYFEKHFLRTIEEGLTHINLIYTQLDPQRHDYQTRFFLKIQRPIATRSGWFIEPSLSVEFVNNESTTKILRRDLDEMPFDDRYDYTDFSIFWGIILRR